jgi:hypothetical protein
MWRVAVALLFICSRLSCQQDGVLVQDIFGRVLNQAGLTLVDWDGYMANPAIKFLVIPPANAQFPATRIDAVRFAAEPKNFSACDVLFTAEISVGRVLSEFAGQGDGSPDGAPDSGAQNCGHYIKDLEEGERFDPAKLKQQAA